MSEEIQDQQFIEYIVKAIVDHPESVTTERTLDEMGTLISLHVDVEDMGTIIGKEGRTAKALRTLLRVLGAKNSARVNLKIIEPENGQGRCLGQNEAEKVQLGHEDSIAQALSDIPQDEYA